MSTLHVGDHVTDKEKDDDVTMIVVGRSPHTADEWRIDADTTVADVNPEYPADDKIIEVIFPQKGDLDIDDQSRYAYPRSRLELTDAVHGDD